MSGNSKLFIDYWYKNEMPFFGIPDPEHKLANLYRQRADIFKLGRMPALFVIAKEGRIRYRHYGNSMSAIPENKDLLSLLDDFNLDDFNKEKAMDSLIEEEKDA